eukprot:3764864-Rhodomonas_salina.1
MAKPEDRAESGVDGSEVEAEEQGEQQLRTDQGGGEPLLPHSPGVVCWLQPEEGVEKDDA